MALLNYSDLQAAIANNAHRSDLTSVIPDFISIAEAKLNRRLRIRAMENVATGAVAASISLPTGFIEMRSISAGSGSATWALTYVPPSQINSESGTPRRYSIAGDSLYFLPASTSYTYTMTYYKGFDPLSSGTNWLMTNAPDVYLYACMVEEALYVKNDADVTKWTAMLEQSIAQLVKADDRDRFGSNLEVRVA